MSNFDQCWKLKKGEYKPLFENLSAVKKDCAHMKQCLKKYEIMPEDIYEFDNDPTFVEVNNCIDKISRKIREGKKSQPVETFLVICLFAGHGILKDGM